MAESSNRQDPTGAPASRESAHDSSSWGNRFDEFENPKAGDDVDAQFTQTSLGREEDEKKQNRLETATDVSELLDAFGHDFWSFEDGEPQFQDNHELIDAFGTGFWSFDEPQETQDGAGTFNVPPQNTHLCHHCRAMLEQWYTVLEERPRAARYPHHPSYVSLLDCVSHEGCRLCWTLFLDCMKQLDISVWTEDELNDWMDIHDDEVEGKAIVYTSRGSSDDWIMEFQLSAPDDSHTAFGRRDWQKSIDYSKSLVLARSWLEECSKSHIACKNPLYLHSNPSPQLSVTTSKVISEANIASCSSCHSTETLLRCLACGHTGCNKGLCGVKGADQALIHWRATGHSFALLMGSRKIWDYGGTQWVRSLKVPGYTPLETKNITAKTLVPSRLVYIGPGNISLQTFSSSLRRNQSIKYATLSHCWGTMKFLTLVKENLRSLKERIVLTDLTQTFQDAIWIAQALGFQYIWIDSLCIIQDDEEDWRKESILMSSVYSNSGLNISADSAEDGNKGCFFSRYPPGLNKCLVSAAVSLEGKQQIFECGARDAYFRCVASQPLGKRAWALQERLLAPRTLHFSRTELFWECNAKTACESYPQDFSPRTHNPDHWFSLKDNLPGRWAKIVGLYSRAKLTYSRDKLVAIAGTAQRIQIATKDQYLGGLWRDRFAKQLSWSVDSPIPLCRKLEDYRAPSWSWASIDDAVIMPEIRWLEKGYFTISDVTVETADGEEFGQPCGGVLTLCCDILLPGWTSIPEPLKSGDPSPKITVFCNYSSLDIFIKWDYKRDLSEETGLHYFMYLEDWRSDATGLTGHGLVLQPTHRARGEYHRVGYFLTDDMECSNTFRTIDSRYEGLVESDLAGTRLGSVGTEQYIIDII